MPTMRFSAVTWEGAAAGFVRAHDYKKRTAVKMLCLCDVTIAGKCVLHEKGGWGGGGGGGEKGVW